MVIAVAVLDELGRQVVQEADGTPSGNRPPPLVPGSAPGDLGLLTAWAAVL